MINKKANEKCARKNHADLGKKKRKTTWQKRAIRLTKKSLPSTSGISSRPTKRQKKQQFDGNDLANICSICEGNYYEETDLQDAEGWIQSPVCQPWHHKTCGVYGKAPYHFIRSNCA